MRVYLNYRLDKSDKDRLTPMERKILRGEIADLLNQRLDGYTILRKELGQFYFEEPQGED